MHLNEKGHILISKCILSGYFHQYDSIPVSTTESNSNSKSMNMNMNEYANPCVDGDAIIHNFIGQRDRIVVPKQGIHHNGRNNPKLVNVNQGYDQGQGHGEGQGYDQGHDRHERHQYNDEL